MDWLAFITNIINRIPVERVLFPPPDHTKALEEFATSVGSPESQKIGASEEKTTPTIQQEPAQEPSYIALEQKAPETPTAAPESHTVSTTPGVSDKDTLLYQLNHLVAVLSQLEVHLSEGLKIMGVPCDCGAKHALQASTFAMETIPIAARMGKETNIYQDIASWTPHIEEIDTPEKVNSGDYDEIYRKESGTASQFRKKVQSMISELKGEGDDDCPGCDEIRETISSFIEKRKRRGEHNE